MIAIYKIIIIRIKVNEMQIKVVFVENVTQFFVSFHFVFLVVHTFYSPFIIELIIILINKSKTMCCCMLGLYEVIIKNER